MYGLVEDMNDVTDAKNILSAIGCDLQALSCVRLGRLKPASDPKLSKLRPLKVELPSVTDRARDIIAASKYRDKLRSFDVNFSPWL